MTAIPGDKVSARHMLLVAMLARGHTTDRAARELRLSRHTVGEEISGLLERFNCRNRAELVAYWYVHRLLPIGIWPPPYSPCDGDTTEFAGHPSGTQNPLRGESDARPDHRPARRGLPGGPAQ